MHDRTHDRVQVIKIETLPSTYVGAKQQDDKTDGDADGHEHDQQSEVMSPLSDEAEEAWQNPCQRKHERKNEDSNAQGQHQGCHEDLVQCCSIVEPAIASYITLQGCPQPKFKQARVTADGAYQHPQTKLHVPEMMDQEWSQEEGDHSDNYNRNPI